jgi:zona occludens toxin
MITLITGTPGAGKTLYAVQHIVKELLPQKRLIFSNINGLRIPQVMDCGADGPFRWEEYPDGTIFVFDEVQHQWPAERRVSEVPPSVKALDTHRHRGMDFVLVTQSPMGIDPRVRRLIGRHIHLHRPLNGSYARVMDWPTVQNDPNPPTAYDDGARQFFKYPKELFDLYDSASLHTMRPRFPWRLAGPVAFLLLIVGVILWNAPTAYQTIAGEGDATAGAEGVQDGQSCFPLVSRDPLTVRSADGLHRLSPAFLDERQAVLTRETVCFPSNG